PSFLTFLIFLTRMNADSRGSFSVCGLRSWRSWGSPALVVARFLAACWLGGWRRWISWPFAGVCGVAVWCLRCGRESRCRWRVGPSAFAGGYLGGGGVGGPRPGRREPVHGGFSATSMSPKPGRRPPTPPPRTIAGATAEGPARHLPGPSPALVVVVGAGSCAGDEASFASACGVRAEASQVTSASLVADAALLAAACSRVQVASAKVGGACQRSDQATWAFRGCAAAAPWRPQRPPVRRRVMRGEVRSGGQEARSGPAFAARDGAWRDRRPAPPPS